MGRSVWISDTLVILTLFSTARTECPQSSSITDPVIMMCTGGNSASTPAVYIDTSASSATVDESGEICSCSAEIQNAKIVKIQSSGFGDACGSNLLFTLDSKNETFETDAECKTETHQKSVAGKETIQIGLEKTGPPFIASYCVHLEIVLCGEKEFQCDDGKCIPGNPVCDQFPDCPDGSDEKNCGTKSGCSEAELSCASGGECYTAEKRCNNVADCTDGSDEQNCGSDGLNITTTPVPETAPLISIHCEKSTRFTTTTTTTTTTTSTTTTTTTTTSTTTTPTTTTSPTTTSSEAPPTTAEVTTPPTTAISTSATSQTTSSSTYSSTSSFSSPSTSSSTSGIPGSTTNIAQDPEAGTTSPLKNPAVIAAIILAAVLVIVGLATMAYIIHKRVNRSQSKNITSSDLWIQNCQEKELEPLNSPLPTV